MCGGERERKIDKFSSGRRFVQACGRQKLPTDLYERLEERKGDDQNVN